MNANQYITKIHPNCRVQVKVISPTSSIINGLNIKYIREVTHYIQYLKILDGGSKGRCRWMKL